MAAPLIGPLSWILIYVDDLAKVRSFYEDVLGLELGSTLRARGADPVHGPSATVSPAGEQPLGRVVQYADPEGNIIEFCDEALAV